MLEQLVYCIKKFLKKLQSTLHYKTYCITIFLCGLVRGGNLRTDLNSAVFLDIEFILYFRPPSTHNLHSRHFKYSLASTDTRKINTTPPTIRWFIVRASMNGSLERPARTPPFFYSRQTGPRCKVHVQWWACRVEQSRINYESPRAVYPSLL